MDAFGPGGLSYRCKGVRPVLKDLLKSQRNLYVVSQLSDSVNSPELTRTFSLSSSSGTVLEMRRFFTA